MIMWLNLFIMAKLSTIVMLLSKYFSNKLLFVFTKNSEYCN